MKETVEVVAPARITAEKKRNLENIQSLSPKKKKKKEKKNFFHTLLLLSVGQMKPDYSGSLVSIEKRQLTINN